MSAWDDIVVGETYGIGSHRFEADDIRRFAARYDPQPFHLDEAAARASLLGGLCASGWHTAAVAMRLNVDHQAAVARRRAAAGLPPSRIGPSPGVRNLRWPRPVMAGDRVTFTQTVTARRPSASRPGWGLVAFATAGVNDEGTTVFASDGAVFFGID